jgi:hypothetical protein
MKGADDSGQARMFTCESKEREEFFFHQESTLTALMAGEDDSAICRIFIYFKLNPSL